MARRVHTENVFEDLAGEHPAYNIDDLTNDEDYGAEDC